jgi:hypothetical protein
LRALGDDAMWLHLRECHTSRKSILNLRRSVSFAGLRNDNKQASAAKRTATAKYRDSFPSTALRGRMTARTGSGNSDDKCGFLRFGRNDDFVASQNGDFIGMRWGLLCGECLHWFDGGGSSCGGDDNKRTGSCNSRSPTGMTTRNATATATTTATAMTTTTITTTATTNARVSPLRGPR